MTAAPLRAYLPILAPAAFLPNLAWEFVQCRTFFVHGSAPATGAAMPIAAAGDVLLTGLAYLAVAAVRRSWRWPLEPWNAAVWAALIGSALALGFAVETVALASGRWSYAPAMPRIPGTPIGAVPVLQLLLLFPLSFALARGVRRSRSPSVDARQ